MSGTTRTGGLLSGRLERVASARASGVHAWVLTSNHYHLLLETPEANLARMGWLQKAYTRRINTRHRLWGHLFGGRYKAILVEPGNCFWALLDYNHLNPVRAGLVHDRDGLEAFGWSSLAAYIEWPSKRPQWLETDMGFSVVGCKDNAGGRREFLGLLEKRVDWRKPSHAGLSFPEEGDGKPDLAIHSALRRLIRRAPEELPECRHWKRMRAEILKNINKP